MVAIKTFAFSPGESKEDLMTGFDESAGEDGATKGGGQIQLTPEENLAFVEAVKKVAAEFEAPDFPLHIAGGPVMDAFFDRAMQRDMSTFLGLAVDDTIHFFHNFRRYFAETLDAREAVRQTLLSTGRAMLFTTLALVTGFWLFMLATMNNVFNFGLLTGVALILALLSDFLLAPALLMLVIKTSYGHSLTLRWCGHEPATVS